MSTEKEARIKAAALELSKALTDHGGKFELSLHGLDGTCIEDVDPTFVYSVQVRMVSEKDIAP